MSTMWAPSLPLGKLKAVVICPASSPVPTTVNDATASPISAPSKTTAYVPTSKPLPVTAMDVTGLRLLPVVGVIESAGVTVTFDEAVFVVVNMPLAKIAC